MNRLLEQLSAFCDTRRLAEKVLIAPSLAIGQQVAEAVLRAGQPWVNLHIETVHTLARGVIQTDLVEEGLRVLSRAQALALIEQACSQTLTADGYFGKLKDQPGFHRALKGTLQDLRTAEISPDDLATGSSGDQRKIHELQAIAKAYERMLAENHFVDEAEVLRRALGRLTKSREHVHRDAIYLLPESLDLTRRERDFLKRLGGEQIHVLAIDHPSEWKPTARSVQMFRALGEENEIREVFRRLVRDGIELDKAEIVYTDGATYLPLIYELSAEYDMSCTYGEGIPVVFSRPGQAVLGYLDWVDGDYDANSLRRIIGADVVDFRRVGGEGEPPGAVHAARVLRDAGVGWGRDRHISCFDAMTSLCRERERAADEGGETRVHQKFHDRHVGAARAVRSFVERLLTVTPETGADGKIALRELARGTAAFVVEFARIAGELDGMASMALRNLLKELSVLPDTRLTPQESAKRLKEAVKSTYVGATTPKPGHLHVSDYGSGGYSGRSHTFVLGMDESRHPGSGLQDPVLLDYERRRINRVISPRRLPLLGERPQENKEALRACLARLRGQVTMSYSCRNLLEDREQFPAATVLEIHRSLVDKPAVDYTALRLALGTPSGFIPSQGICLDETEWWLGRLRELGTQNDETSSVIRSVYPWLGRGWRSQQERAGDRFTSFDGWVKGSNGELDPRVNREPISCTEIEALARCPFAYFLRYVLEIEPLEDRGRDLTVWLDAMEFGSLLHEIFRAFMTEITARNEKPRFTQHWAYLKTVAEACMDRWRARVPPPNAAALITQRNHILVSCQTFLRNEEIHCQHVAPCYFEVPFGLSGVESAAPIASQNPVPIELDEGSNFLLRGRVDRVDHRGGDEYEVWDYKAGSSRSVREERQLNRGRQIQHALYARAVEILLARALKRGRVVRSGYFFPGPKGEGQRISKELSIVALQRVLTTLFDLLGEGVFPCALDSDFCGFCGYRTVCGGSEKANQRSAAKLKNREASAFVLEPLRRLIDCDD